MFDRFLGYVLSFHRTLRLADELASLSDRELADIGLNRSQLEGHTWFDPQRVIREEVVAPAARAPKLALVPGVGASFGTRG